MMHRDLAIGGSVFFRAGWSLPSPLGCFGPGPVLWWGLASGLAVVAILLTLRLSFDSRSRPIGAKTESGFAVRFFYLIFYLNFFK